MQQKFLVSLLAEIKKQDLLGNLAKTYKITDSLTKALTTDSELASLPGLTRYAQSVQGGIDPESIEAITLPVFPDDRLAGSI
ncbi:hypothetical protein H9Y04_44805 [Streptomyces sp. TRM66268-LWL]|uniref:Uncharacterized protein n=1 Tax=Streptomyces polyasparticus TaxID=2767826 RepID=A0ABR7SVV0_9ACTN|nr:hypothetical protein [Streptomyces polyasparticus]MBC9719615.1 hypothetical protein [Streptomyces polyasparticus]